MEERLGLLHWVLAALAQPLLPGSSALVPATPRGRCQAALLLQWALLGWLLPTLLLLRRAAVAAPHGRQLQPGQLERQQQQQQPAPPAALGAWGGNAGGGGGGLDGGLGDGKGTGVALVLALQALQPPAAEVDDWAPGPPWFPDGRLLWALRWWVLLCVAWAACCILAEG